MPSVFEMALAKLAQEQQPAPQGMTPEQIAARIGTNNRQMELGLLGQLSQDQQMSGVGGQIFKQAMGERAPVKTVRGTTDPLTGETQVDPMYAEEQENRRRDSVFQAALRYEDQRLRAEERAARAAEAADLRRELAAGRAATTGQITDLRGDLLREQIEARRLANAAAAKKQSDAVNKRKLAMENQAAQVNVVLGKVQEAENMISAMNTGVGAAFSKSIPGLQYLTGVPDFEATIDTIKANLGFDQLARMREASQTGGALGQVTVKEIEFLQNTIASLDTRQSVPTLRKNLKQIRESMTRVIDNFRQMGLEVPEELDGTDIAAPSVAGSPGAAGAVPAAAPTPGRVRLIRGPDGKLVPAQ